LICVRELKTPPELQLVFAIYPYVMITSSIFLIATFVVYAIIPEFQNTFGVSVMCHVASLATTYIFLAVIQLDPMLPKPACIALGNTS
jgi:G protein-coupled receptor Mth (Methuselah protein)